MIDSNKKFIVIILWSLVSCSRTHGRKVNVRLHVVDPMFKVMMEEEDAFKVTVSPSNVPSSFPSKYPTSTPSNSPSLTQLPSMSPSNIPSRQPSETPSDQPSDIPSVTPTISMMPSRYTNKGQKGYFSYNPDDKDYGPDAWKYIKNTVEAKTWLRFPDKVWEFERDNQCGYNNRQSPIDVCDGVGDGTDITKSQNMTNVNSPCFEYHRSYAEARDWRIDDTDKIKTQILPTKLRLFYEKRDCPYQEGFGVKNGGSSVWFPLPESKGGIYEWCDYEPPAIDFPNHWNGHIQPIHIDVKFPSEHTICGKRYEGEFIVYHAHPQRQSVITMSTLIEVGSHNFEMQKAIDSWQKKFNEDQWACMRRRNRHLRNDEQFQDRVEHFLKTGLDHEQYLRVYDEDFQRILSEAKHSPNNTTLQHILDHSDRRIQKERTEFLQQYHRRTNQKKIFDPYGDEIYRSKWFYGYWGSLTEPPCSGRFVTHRIMDAPMQVSKEQLEQMKHILFDHIDENCYRSSMDYKGSVARPLQPFNNRTLWRCNRDRWEHDFESWRCDDHNGTQFGCVREGQTMIHGELE